ncbi:MAG: MFS transporter [Sneathiella sp.]|uniref:MFS transporter n=1 Tax=Sneathiella sp. TaxID=1964365 RepID=UPI003001B70B
MKTTKPSEFTAIAIGILAVCFLIGMIGRFSYENFPNLVSPLGVEFGWSRGTIASIYSLGALFTGLTGPIAGILFDRLGPRNVYSIGILSGGAGLMLAAMADNIWFFYLSISILVGFSAACCGNVTNSALASRWFREKLPLALAIIYSALGAGTLLGLSLSQIFISNFGWRQAEFLLGICVLVALPVILFLPWRKLAAGRKSAATASPKADAVLPVIWTMSKAVRTIPFWGLSAVFCFTGSAMFSVIIQAVTYLIEVGLPPIEASVSFGITGLFIPVGMIGSGYLIRRIGLLTTAMGSYIVTLAAILFLWSFETPDQVWALYGFILCFGLSMGSRGPMIGTIASHLYRGKNFGTIYGSISVGSGIGMASGSYFSGLLYDLTGTYDAVFLYSGISLLIGAAPFILVREMRKQP